MSNSKYRNAVNFKFTIKASRAAPTLAVVAVDLANRQSQQRRGAAGFAGVR
jgi:hypothetical protein